MIHELRIYTFHPGRIPEYLKLVEEVGAPIRGDRYGVREGSWIAEFGPLNTVVHLWRYDDLNHRQQCREALAQNKDWTHEFVPQIRPLLRRQEVAFLSAVKPVSPPPGQGNVYELRRYRARLGRAAEFANKMVEYLPAREKYSKNVGIWLTEAPQPHEICHIWAYDDLNTRLKQRAASQGDPDWQNVLRLGPECLEEMSAMAMLPAPFSPMQ